MCKKISILLLTFIFLSFTGLALSDSASDPLKQIQSSFPDTIQIGIDGGRNIEFCPDNTCEFFVAKKNAPTEELQDFVFLYLYFFSGYYILEEWRMQHESSFIAKKILSKYKNCQNKTEKISAKCILKHLSQKNKIKLFEVRYDENARNVRETNLETELAK